MIQSGKEREVTSTTLSTSSASCNYSPGVRAPRPAPLARGWRRDQGWAPRFNTTSSWGRREAARKWGKRGEMICIANNDGQRWGGALSECKCAICIIGRPGLNGAQRRIRITQGDREGRWEQHREKTLQIDRESEISKSKRSWRTQRRRSWEEQRGH